MVNPEDHDAVDEQILGATTDDGPMSVLVKAPSAGAPGDVPTVAMFHDGPGMRSATHVFSRKLAGAGYRVVVPDLYHRHGDMIGFEPAQVAEKPELRDQAWAMLNSLTDDGIQHDLDAGLAVAGVGADEPLLVIGFCLGARAVHRTLMRLPERVVAGAMWHPSFLADDEPDSPHLSASDLTCPLYIGIGTADQMQSIEMHQRYFDAVAGLDHVEVETFEGADHGYTWPDAPGYHEVAAEGSWAKTIAMFGAALPR
jgi:carboxymethylenebutenolidase